MSDRHAREVRARLREVTHAHRVILRELAQAVGELDEVRRLVRTQLLRCMEPVTRQDGCGHVAACCLHELPCPVHPHAVANLEVMRGLHELPHPGDEGPAVRESARRRAALGRGI